MAKKSNKDAIKQLIQEVELVGMSENEALKYIQVKLGGTTISARYYYQLKQELHADPDRQAWLSYYAKAGFVDHYRTRLKEMQMIQSDLMRMWVIENNKQDKTTRDKYLITKLSSEIRENNVVLCQLGVSMPFIASMKAMMDNSNNNQDNEKILELMDGTIGYDEYRHLNQTSSDQSTKDK
jgi:hypothetical protein